MCCTPRRVCGGITGFSSVLTNVTPSSKTCRWSVDVGQVGANAAPLQPKVSTCARPGNTGDDAFITSRRLRISVGSKTYSIWYSAVSVPVTLKSLEENSKPNRKPGNTTGATFISLGVAGPVIAWKSMCLLEHCPRLCSPEPGGPSTLQVLRWGTGGRDHRRRETRNRRRQDYDRTSAELHRLFSPIGLFYIHI